jgi:phytoene dehydrogenase-like protein
MRKAAVIGAGIGGIAGALRLAHKGYDVNVFEANDYPGGKLSAFTLGKYRFDSGPSLFTMPHLVNDLFELFNENPSEYFNYKKKKIACQYFWDDHTELTAYSNNSLYFDEVENKLGIKSNSLKKYLDRAKRKYELTAPLFFRTFPP